MKKFSKRLIALFVTFSLVLSMMANFNNSVVFASSMENNKIETDIDNNNQTSNNGNVSIVKNSDNSSNVNINAYSDTKYSSEITNVEVDISNKTMIIEWYGQASKVVIEFYDEEFDGENDAASHLISRKTQDVTSSATEIVKTNVSYENDSSIPMYFILKIYMLDEKGNVASYDFLSNSYTKDIYELRNMTAEDYKDEGDRLIDVDKVASDDEELKDNDTFMVLKDDVILIKEESASEEGTDNLQVNIVPTNDENSLMFSLGNVDSKLADELNNIEGKTPVFVIDKSSESSGVKTNFYMLNINSAQMDDANGAIIYGENLNANTDEGEVEYSNLQTIFEAYKGHTEKEYSTSFSLPLASYGTISAKPQGKITFELCIDFGKSNICAISYENDLHCKDTEIDIDSPSIFFDVPILQVPIGLPGLIEFDVGVSARVSGSASGGVRFDYDLNSGYELGLTNKGRPFVNNKSKGSDTKFQGFSLTGSIFTGLAFGVSFEIVKLISLSADVESGFDISGTLNSGHYFEEEKIYHACKDFECIDGEVSLKLLGYSFSINVLMFSRGLAGNILPPQLICNLYYSGTYKTSGRTECPHKGYKLNVHVVDQNGKSLSDVDVSYPNDDTQFESLKEGKTDADGNAVIYVPEGTYDITADLYKSNLNHHFSSVASFVELGFDEENGDLYNSELEIEIDMSYNTVSFHDLNQEGKASNMPSNVYTYPESTSTAIPDNTPTKEGHVFLGWDTNESSKNVVYKPGDKIEATNDIRLYAVWAYDSYNVKFDSNKPKNASTEMSGSMSDMTLKYNESTSLSANAYSLPGWSFKGWNTKADGSGDSFTDKQEVNNLYGASVKNITLYAQWEPKTYTVTFDDEEGHTKTQEMVFDTAEKLEPCTFTKTDNIFTYWSTLAFGSKYLDESSVVNLCNLDSNGDPEGITLYPNWVEADSAVILITDNGKSVDTNNPENDITLINYNTGEEFNGVFEHMESGVYAISDTAAIPEGTYKVRFSGALEGYDTDDRTIEVDTSGGAYNFNYCTVSISSDDHATSWIESKGNTTKEKVLVGTQLEIGTEVDEGYTFESYTAVGSTPGFEKDDPTKANQTITVTGEVQIDAHPLANLYTIQFIPNFENGGPTITQDMVYDEPQNLFANQFVRYGYEFVGWTEGEKWSGEEKLYTDMESVKNLTSENGGNVKLYAQWNPVQTFIKFDPNGGDGSMLDQTTYYENNTKLIPCEFTREYYDFVGWNTKADGSGTSYADKAEFISDNGEKDSTVTLYAQWKLTDYSIEYDLNGGTLSKENPTTYTYETDSFTLNNPTKIGYNFIGWTGSNGDTPEKNVTVKKGSSGDMKYTANWEPIILTIIFDPNGGTWADGTTGKKVITAEYGSTITIPDAPKKNGATFKYFEGSNNKYSSGQKLIVTSNIEFKAHWSTSSAATGDSNDMSGLIFLMTVSFIGIGLSIRNIRRQRKI